MPFDLNQILAEAQRDPNLPAQLKQVAKIGILFSVLRHTIQVYDSSGPGQASKVATEIVRALVAKGELDGLIFDLDHFTGDQDAGPIDKSPLPEEEAGGEVVARTDEDLFEDEQRKENPSWTDFVGHIEGEKEGS